MKTKSLLLAMPLRALVGCALEAPVDVNTPQLARARFDYGNGRNIYATYCSGCHHSPRHGGVG